MLTNEYALLTHKNCPDGSACCIVFTMFGGTRENVFFSNPGHGETDESLKEIIEKGFKKILIADVSISLKFAEEISKEKDLEIVLLDHHKTAFPLKKLSWCLVDDQNNECGSKLLFNFLKKQFSGVIVSQNDEKYIDYVDDFDRWIKNYQEGDNLAAMHGFYNQKTFIDRFINRKNKSELNDHEKWLLELEQEKMKEEALEKKKQVKNNILTKELQGKMRRIGFVSGAKYISTTGNALCEDPELNLDAVVLVGGNSISLRGSAMSDFDCSLISKHFGGGGHMKASGLSTSAILGNHLLQLVFEKINSLS